MTYTIFEHTADLGIDAEGDDAGECLSAAAEAVTSIVTDRKDLHATRPDGELDFTVEAPDMDALAVAFLSEVLWFLESESLLWLTGGTRVEPTQDGWKATARANATVYDPSIHGQGTEIKAVTYHALRFAQEGKRWRLRIVVDI